MNSQKRQIVLIAFKAVFLELYYAHKSSGNHEFEFLSSRSRVRPEIFVLLLNIYILLIMLLQLSHFPPLFPSTLHIPFPPAFSVPLSSCPWAIHVSSLASPFPILFLTSSYLFCTYHLCYLFPVPFPSILPLPFPAENPQCDLHFRDSVPVLVICIICFFFKFLLLFNYRCMTFLPIPPPHPSRTPLPPPPPPSSLIWSMCPL